MRIFLQQDVFFNCRYKYFPNQRSGVQGFGSAPQPRAQFRNPEPNARRHAWGAGNVLGGN